MTGFGGSTGGSQAYMEQGGFEFTPEMSDEFQRTKRSTLYFTRMVNDLAKFLGTSPDIESVLNERNAQVAVDYRAYTQRLWADAGLESVVFDFGVPLPMLDIDEVSSELPIEVVPIFRIEPLIAELLKQDLVSRGTAPRLDEAGLLPLSALGSDRRSVCARRNGCCGSAGAAVGSRRAAVRSRRAAVRSRRAR